jgi:hypothetical protein
MAGKTIIPPAVANMENFELRPIVIPSKGIRRRIVGAEGKVAKIKLRPLKAWQKEKLIQVIRETHAALREPNDFDITKDIFALVMRCATFMVTSHRAVQAGFSFYEGGDRRAPVILLGEDVWDDIPEFRVTLLHEALHLVQDHEGESAEDSLAQSKTEAVHDLFCYKTLGQNIPTRHWALQKFPELLKPEQQHMIENPLSSQMQKK